MFNSLIEGARNCAAKPQAGRVIVVIGRTPVDKTAPIRFFTYQSPVITIHYKPLKASASCRTARVSTTTTTATTCQKHCSAREPRGDGRKQLQPSLFPQIPVCSVSDRFRLLASHYADVGKYKSG